jgi:hypothetical protein
MPGAATHTLPVHILSELLITLRLCLLNLGTDAALLGCRLAGTPLSLCVSETDAHTIKR